jgi:hypothetical protein
MHYKESIKIVQHLIKCLMAPCRARVAILGNAILIGKCYIPLNDPSSSTTLES